jgi:hypothetical protein
VQGKSSEDSLVTARCDTEALAEGHKQINIKKNRYINRTFSQFRALAPTSPQMVLYP